jgi:hypothetical protein
VPRWHCQLTRLWRNKPAGSPFVPVAPTLRVPCLIGFDGQRGESWLVPCQQPAGIVPQVLCLLLCLLELRFPASIQQQCLQVSHLQAWGPPLPAPAQHLPWCLHSFARFVMPALSPPLPTRLQHCLSQHGLSCCGRKLALRAPTLLTNQERAAWKEQSSGWQLGPPPCSLTQCHTDLLCRLCLAALQLLWQGAGSHLAHSCCCLSHCGVCGTANLPAAASFPVCRHRPHFVPRLILRLWRAGVK